VHDVIEVIDVDYQELILLLNDDDITVVDVVGKG
jgi:hypothetical protein